MTEESFFFNLGEAINGLKYVIYGLEMNIALKKPVVEKNVINPEVVTNGCVTEYKGSSGSKTFSHFKWPGTLTINLKKVYIVKCIRFLLWDGMGQPGAQRHSRKYKYRLETSTDGENFDLLYDTEDNGYNGWQQFIISDGIEMQFIKIYGRYNSSNPQFHIVEVEAYEEDTPPPLEAEIVLEKKISKSIPKPVIPGGPLSKVGKIVEALQKVQGALGSSEIEKICKELVNVTGDLEILEKNIESVKNQIIGPVNESLKNSFKLAWISIILAIVSVSLTMPWDRLAKFITGFFKP